jgi:DNA repair protein RadA
MSDLSTVKGINSRHIKLLRENGISTAEMLAMSSQIIISDIKGLGEKSARKLIWNARDALNMTEFTPVSEMHENTEIFTTGSSELDRILGGGMQTGKITEMYGPFKSGKTNVAHTIAVTMQLPKKQGGLGGAVAYIDTENTFSRNKIIRIAKRFNYNPKEAISKIYHARIFSSDHQDQMILKAETLCKNRHVRLVIVDSLMALLRAEYVGIGMLARRQSVLNNMIHALSRIAEMYNAAVLLTNQVATQMKGMFSADDAIGGNIVAHGCHFRVMLKTKGFSANSSLKRRAVIVDAPDLPPEECEFFITNAGVADTEEVEIPDGESLDFELENIYEESSEDDKSEDDKIISTSKAKNIELTDIKGIGKGTLENLNGEGIKSVDDLLKANPKSLSAKINGVSDSMVKEWQKHAQVS